MGAASYIQSSFIGGLVSKWTQGRYHDQHYRTWMDICLNGFPTETEGWVRRPGFQLCGTTRSGNPGRLIRFDFQQSAPYTMELTDGHLRFWQSNVLAISNDPVHITSISAATPAVITLANVPGFGAWPTGTQINITGLNNNPLLENRTFTVTQLTSTTYSIVDAVTGTSINGALLNPLTGNENGNRIYEISTPYFGTTWQSLRIVQTGLAAFFLHPAIIPTMLICDSPPIGNKFATFAGASSFGGVPLFEDGPYLDPIPGSTVAPGATTGIVSLTAGYQPYVSTQAYTIGAFVSSGGIGYQSIKDANVGNTPAGSPSFWKVVGFGAAINNGQGFTASDIGRLVRLFSEPAAWSSVFTYASGQIVYFNPSNIPGQEQYYAALTSTNVNNTPGTDAKNWQLVAIGSAQNPALWTWGKITGLGATGVISGGTGTPFGTMTSNGGLAAAFDGVTNKPASTCAKSAANNDGVVGKNFTGSPQTISQVIAYPSNDFGFAENGTPMGGAIAHTVHLRLWAKASAPASPTDGTLLADTGIIANAPSAPITFYSNDTVTAWNYVWVEILNTDSISGFIFEGVFSAQVIMYTNAAAPGTTVNCEILGPPLIYAGITIQTWRLGVYSNTTGWPNVGTYSDGRLWLASAGYPNRIDSCVANGINGVNNGSPAGAVNFAPTDQYGVVSEANAISYTFNAPSVDPIVWMIPDQQGILCGTASAEWLVIAPTAGGLSPLNIAARRATVVGCANIEPRRCEHTIVFVQGQLRKIMEYFADVFSGKFSAPNLSIDAKQLTIGNIQEIAYQQELVPIIWARVNNGLIASTYKRVTLMTSSGPTQNGWHQHQLGSNRQTESLVVGSATNGTLLSPMIISNDPNMNIRFVELMTPVLDEGSVLNSAMYLDAAVTATSSTAIAISLPNFPNGGLRFNGLWNLNGYTVTAWLGGLDCGDYLVSNGSISVAYGDGVPNGQGSFPPGSVNRGDQGLFTANFVTTGMTANGVQMFTPPFGAALFGFSYTSQGRIVRPNVPAEGGTRSGPGFGKWRRSEWIMMQLEGSQGVSWGADTLTQPVPLRQPDGITPYTIDLQFTGVVRDNLINTYSFDSKLSWQVTRPFICNVQAIGAALETQDL